jgi:hypothetical protein
LLWDVERDEDGEPIDTPIERVRCPQCRRTMDYHDSSQQYRCPGCLYQVTEAYDQVALPSEEAQRVPQSKGKVKPYMKSYSSSRNDLESEDFLFNKESEKYVGSSQDALAAEYQDFQYRQQDERADILRERYNDTELNQSSENELLKFREERDRKSRMNESK